MRKIKETTYTTTEKKPDMILKCFFSPSVPDMIIRLIYSFIGDQTSNICYKNNNKINTTTNSIVSIKIQ